MALRYTQGRLALDAGMQTALRRSHTTPHICQNPQQIHGVGVAFRQPGMVVVTGVATATALEGQWHSTASLAAM